MSTKIDPRGPRFGAAITSTLLAVTVFLALDWATSLAAQLLLDAISVLFAIGAIFGNAKHPYGWIFKNFVRPRLGEPKVLEDAAPPRFAQLIGLLVAGTGAILGHLGFDGAVLISAALAFFAAFLNAAFNFCLGCQIYFGLKRLRVIR